MSGRRHARDDIDTPPDDTEYGEQRTRRQTTYYYRQSSSLSPAQIMMRDVLYDQAEDFLIHSLILGRVITTLLLLSKHVFANRSAKLDNIFR
jgi:hypothetical protein